MRILKQKCSRVGVTGCLGREVRWSVSWRPALDHRRHVVLSSDVRELFRVLCRICWKRTGVPIFLETRLDICEQGVQRDASKAKLSKRDVKVRLVSAKAPASSPSASALSARFLHVPGKFRIHSERTLPKPKLQIDLSKLSPHTVHQTNRNALTPPRERERERDPRAVPANASALSLSLSLSRVVRSRKDARGSRRSVSSSRDEKNLKSVSPDMCQEDSKRRNGLLDEFVDLLAVAAHEDAAVDAARELP